VIAGPEATHLFASVYRHIAIGACRSGRESQTSLSSAAPESVCLAATALTSHERYAW
jgi:hypothetical protein